MRTETDRWLEVATVGRAHGVRGEIYVRPHNPTSELLVVGARFRLDGAGGEEVTVAALRETAKGWLVRFEGVGQREAAAALTNCKLSVRRGDLPEIDSNEVYLADLVGLSAVDQTGRPLGVVHGFFHNGAHDVCVIRDALGEDVLVPFRNQNVVDICWSDRQIRLDLPEGIPGIATSATEPTSRRDGFGPER